MDVGRSAEIPAAIRRAVILRDQHCRWAGGCDQPAAGCEVHHLTHQADGGPTSVWDCALFCFFHHHVAIHQWGWTVTLHPDGTTTARSPDGTKVFRSHGPPARPG
ncbi:MAG TPA: HNH endonuclease signature motif containing protein [Streptosporangiaceae bacterium]|nr:HNH endonuclease signature motif containing protein [Streptosporangiaceae bacterium]